MSKNLNYKLPYKNQVVKRKKAGDGVAFDCEPNSSLILKIEMIVNAS